MKQEKKEKKKSNWKRVVLPTTACALAACMAIGGTLAYLTDNEEHTNVFTLGGDVTIDLTETEWPGDGVDRVQYLVSNEEIAKNPVITNNGTSPAIVFMRVTVPTANVTEVADDGTRLGSRDYETGQTLHADGRSYEGDDYRTGSTTLTTYAASDGQYKKDLEVSDNNYGDYAKGTQYNGGTAVGKTRTGQSDPHRTMQDLFYFKQNENAQSDHNNHFDNSWIELFGEEDQDVSMDTGSSTTGNASNFGVSANGETNKGDDLNTYQMNSGDEKYGTRTYVFAYYRPLAGTDAEGNDDVQAFKQATAWTGVGNTGVYYNSQDTKDNQTTALFDKVQLKNIMEDEVASGMSQEIRVEAYAIQARDVLNGAASGASTGQSETQVNNSVGTAGQTDGVGDYTDLMTRENLERIYDVFMRQTGLTDAVYDSITKTFGTHNGTVGGSTNEANNHNLWNLGNAQAKNNETGNTIVRQAYKNAQDQYKANIAAYNTARSNAVAKRDQDTHDDTPSNNTNDTVHDSENTKNTTRGSGNKATSER